MRRGLPHRGGLPGQPGRVTRLGGVIFLHVNAEGGAPPDWCDVHSGIYLVWKPHPSTPGLLILHVKARFF